MTTRRGGLVPTSQIANFRRMTPFVRNSARSTWLAEALADKRTLQSYLRIDIIEHGSEVAPGGCLVVISPLSLRLPLALQAVKLTSQ